MRGEKSWALKKPSQARHSSRRQPEQSGTVGKGNQLSQHLKRQEVESVPLGQIEPGNFSGISGS